MRILQGGGMQDYSALFSEIKIKKVALKNRIVVPPMVTKRNISHKDGIEWYSRFARGGAGLVIVEATAVNRFGTDVSFNGLKQLADAVHKEGCAIAIQLFPVTFGRSVKPEELSDTEMKQIITLFRNSVRILEDAGFDGAEPHGAHGFVINQFFSPIANKRKDSYAGTLKNRMRFGIEIVQNMKKSVGEDFIILYRHTPRENNGYSIEDSVDFAKELIGAGVDVLDISPASDKEPADMAEPFKRETSAPVIAVNNMDNPERAITALKKKRADLIAIGRGLIADAELPNKIKENRIDEIIECVKCNEKCFGNLHKGIPIECAQWK